MNAKHTLVTGSSGGGKTTYCREMHATASSCSVFLTTKSHESNVRGRAVAGRRALNSAVKPATRPSDVKCKWYGARYPEATRTVRAWAHDVAEHRGWPVQVIVDECQETPLNKSEGALKRGLHQDRDRGIKWVPTTQSPQDLKEDRGYKGINQCNYIVWCGPAKTFHSGFIQYYNLDGVLPEEEYEYHVIEPSRPPQVVHEGRTKRKYG